MFASTKYVGVDRGYFWVLWSVRGFAHGECLECGFSADLAEALLEIRTAPCARRKRIHLLPALVAGQFFYCIWEGRSLDGAIPMTWEDRLFEVERLKFDINEQVPQSAPKRPGRPHRSSSGGVPWWSTVLGLRLPCTRDDVRAAFRARALNEHPDHGGTNARFVQLKRAYEKALEEVVI